MMKRSMKKLGVMAAAFTLALSSLTVTAQAAVFPRPVAASSMNEAVPMWDYLITMLGDLEINSLGYATITVYCNSEYGEVTKIKAKCELQRLENHNWKTIKTWTESNDISTISYVKETAVYKGYSYRLKITAYAYNGSTLLEQATETFDYGYYQ